MNAQNTRSLWESEPVTSVNAQNTRSLWESEPATSVNAQNTRSLRERVTERKSTKQTCCWITDSLSHTTYVETNESLNSGVSAGFLAVQLESQVDKPASSWYWNLAEFMSLKLTVFVCRDGAAEYLEPIPVTTRSGGMSTQLLLLPLLRSSMCASNV